MDQVLFAAELEFPKILVPRLPQRILSKLRYNTSLNLLKIIYHFLFGSHLQHGTQLSGQRDCVNQNNIQKLQNWAFSKITFKNLHDLVNPLCKDLKVLKFKDLPHLLNCLFVLKIEQSQTLAKYFVTLKHFGDNHI